ncbi:methyltransferase [Bosea sp. (in: a-proteobacteria)]|uniref:tRNA1(Val) (adenine(37)-N6)-methyltransferase n=1 Tax=Bosea sp. (in: a-proteobacteria) TaxID=1871050 RepID=UPI00262C355A|nr:methyltransferase [Bosea sp. (in: a-proteobacteria)]MCO5092374.1 methyltransferase [Bosea sp. (in: a-proteobacteria)]
MSEAGLGEIVEDRLLDGRLRLLQPARGHRAGSDALLLAAALPELAEGALLDIGAGVGTVGLAAALAQPGLRVTLLERDPELAALARRNAALNGMAGRVDVIAADVAARAAILSERGLVPASFDAVAMNPPFYPPGGSRASPVPNRKAAHVAEEGALAPWLRAARRLLRPGGHLALIHRAEALPEVLAGLSTGFGALAVRPVHAFADRPAIRILVTAVMNSRKPAALLPAFVINSPDGKLAPLSEALHRGYARLPGYQ